MYEFGETIGGLERCYYFGHGKDLYHFDHFMGEHSSRAVCPLARICRAGDELLYKYAEHSKSVFVHLVAHTKARCCSTQYVYVFFGG